MVHSSLPDSWATTESTKKEASALLFQLSSPLSPSKLLLQVKGLSWETEVEQENQNAKVP